MSQGKNWVFTHNNYTSEPDMANFVDIVYGIYGHEIAPTTNTPHLQGYLSFSKRKRLNQVTVLIPGAHFDVARGTPEQNIEYCSKGADIRRVGNPPNPSGHRTDLEQATQDIKAGKSLDVVANDHPCVFAKYSKGLSALRSALQKPTMRLDIKVLVLYGSSGKGKTRYAFDRYGPTQIYKLDPNHNHSLWFDGYIDQKVLLIDDFDGWIGFRTLLTLLDIYPYTCQVKGSTVPAQWQTVIITSEKPVEDWYLRERSGDIAQLKRRITQIVSVDGDDWKNQITI